MLDNIESFAEINKQQEGHLFSAHGIEKMFLCSEECVFARATWPESELGIIESIIGVKVSY
jgi:hypothetical protein